MEQVPPEKAHVIEDDRQNKIYSAFASFSRADVQMDRTELKITGKNGRA